MNNQTLLSDQAIKKLVAIIKGNSCFHKSNQTADQVSITTYYYSPGPQSRILIVKTLEQLNTFIIDQVELSKEDLEVFRNVTTNIHCVTKKTNQPSYIRDKEIESVINFYWNLELILCNILNLPFQDQEESLIPLDTAYGFCTNNIMALKAIHSAFVGPLTVIRNNIYAQIHNHA